ncbi:NADH dehydrogenase [ubiquinone] 1 alpha subcomplex assembly factor 4 [Latimeria chalumnae]|uniref:NADH dehydrogenase [ubiquinone] 1 alpha subcomplex assembly factor 4 n=1 Tax=Latimeria chalumnae TaxID=7897 RepID=H2ZYJ1_LATCH|nr:PREDICTED: NADH dehydrogenase [ubiquinone] 1 alpha subcomplex assembly factor 4 [Latimeria chalumnae]|eukprot:XP_006004932.1 PREDICTED: NADH dehydrogenase [ubiquinone] 1 alpha subcomplex assembly factor 4 [Latimeria chalumnae]
MGARVTRVFRSFNLENRAHAEVGRAKPRVAPRYPSTEEMIEETVKTHPEASTEIHRKDEQLLSLLKNVYVKSKDPLEKKLEGDEQTVVKDHDRLPKSVVKHDLFGILDVKTVPKGKLSIVEALTILSNYKRSPKTWTAEKIAEEYSLELKDTESLLEFFIPFDVKVMPPPPDAKSGIKAV